MDKTSPIGITPERQDYSCLPARDQHEQESEGPARAGDRWEGIGVRETHPQRSQVTPKGGGGDGEMGQPRGGGVQRVIWRKQEGQS